MSSETLKGGTLYLALSGVIGIFAFSSLAALLSGWTDGFGGLTAGLFLAFPVGCIAYLTLGRNTLTGIILSTTVTAVWIVALIGSHQWATGEYSSYDGADDLAFLFMASSLTLIAIMAVGGIWFGHGLTLLRRAKMTKSRPANATH